MGLLGCSGCPIQSRSGRYPAAAFAIDRLSAITALTRCWAVFDPRPTARRCRGRLCALEITAMVRPCQCSSKAVSSASKSGHRVDLGLDAASIKTFHEVNKTSVGGFYETCDCHIRGNDLRGTG